MSVEPVSCTIKTPVALQIGDTVSDLSRPGVYITDITLAEPVNVSISDNVDSFISENACNTLTAYCTDTMNKQ